MTSSPDLQQILPWLAAAAALIGAALLAISIRNLLSMLKSSELLRVPLQERQEVTFPAAGPVVLCVEGPLLTRRFGALDFALETMGGSAVPGRNNLFRAKSSSFSKVRLQLQTYRLPHPGRYVLRIHSLGEAQPDDAEHAIVFARPHLAATVGYILSIIVAAWLLIGGIVLCALSLAPAG